MKAVLCKQYGPPEKLEYGEVPKPEPKENEVLIGVRAAGVNDWDLSIVTGKPGIYRLMSGLMRPKTPILGCDVAGIVKSTGSKVTRFRIGDRVYGDTSGCGFGGFAEYLCVPESALATVPKGMSFEEAAALPQAGMLAYQGLTVKGPLNADHRVLINGGGGGVGMLGIQMLKVWGCHVTGVDHGDKLEAMKGIGFDEVIDYTREDFTERNEKWDLILDNKTTRHPKRYGKVLMPDGMYATVGGDVGRLLQCFLLGPLVTLGTQKQVKVVALNANKYLQEMNRMYQDGQLKPVMDRIYPLEQTAQALVRFAASKHVGKIVVRVGDSN